MNKSLALLSAILLTGTALPAIAADDKVKSETTIDHDDDGGYEAKRSDVRSTDAATDKREVKADLDVDSDGDATKKVTTTTSHDPKGLFNKETTKTVDTTKVKDGQVTTEHHKKVNGDTVVDTKSSR